MHSLELLLLNELFVLVVMAVKIPAGVVALILNDRLLFSAFRGSIGAHDGNWCNSLTMVEMQVSSI